MAQKQFLSLPKMDRINIESFQWGTKTDVDGAKLGDTEVSIFRHPDQSTVALFRATMNGEVFKEAVVILEGDTKTFHFKMKMAFIESFSTDTHTNTEHLGMKCTMITLE